MMSKMTRNQNSFGAYFVGLIKQHNFSQSEFAKRLNVSRTYLFDVFNGRVKPPAHDMQDRIVALLELKSDEREEFYNKSAVGRKELPKDIFEFLYNNASEQESIRERMRV